MGFDFELLPPTPSYTQGALLGWAWRQENRGQRTGFLDEPVLREDEDGSYLTQRKEKKVYEQAVHQAPHIQ